MKNQIQFSILFIVLGFYSLQAQVTQEWVARYNGPGNGSDFAYSLAVYSSGNVYVTGHSTGSGTGNDYATIKYNSSGVQQWAQRYSGTGNTNDVAHSIAVDDSENVYVAGGCESGMGYYSDFATIKYNSSGIQQWVQRYNGPGNGDDRASSLAVDDSGNIYVTGSSRGIGSDDDYATIKYNSSGVEQWVQRYNGPGNNYYDYASSVAVDSSGNVYVTGLSIGSTWDFATIKYNSSGVQQWIRRYSKAPPKMNYLPSLAVSSGNVYVTGQSLSSDYATIKYNSSGDQLWIQSYNGTGNSHDLPTSIAVDSLGNVYVTGSSTGSGIGQDYATIKYNSSGIQQWVQRYDGPANNHDEARSIEVDGSGNIYVTGYSPGIETGNDCASIKYSSSGDQLWVQRYNGPGNFSDGAHSLAVDDYGIVYVTGGSFGIGSGYDYATIKYSQLTGITQTSNSIPEKFSLSQNYPNPFNPVTNLEFGIPSAAGGLGFVSLKVYNMLGKEVATLVNSNLNAGNYNYQLSTDDYQLTSGVYFYKLAVEGNIIDTKRMVVLK